MKEAPPNSKPVAELLQAPAEVSAVLETLRRNLIAAAGEQLAGLIVFGSIARGRYRPKQSDVNVLVLLRDTSRGALDAVAPALKAAWRAALVDPLIVGIDEIARMTDVFPVKLHEIQSHHVVLFGDNPLANLAITREHLRLRTEQELRNLLLRLRRRYVSIAGDDFAMAAALADAARSLAVDLAVLMHLAGKDLPDDSQSDRILAAAAQAFDLDGAALARMAELRRGDAPNSGLTELYGQALRTIERAVDIADRLEVEA